MWMKLNEIVDFDRTTNPATPITQPIFLKKSDLCLVRKSFHGTEVRVKDTWIQVTDTVDFIMDYDVQVLLNENL